MNKKIRKKLFMLGSIALLIGMAILVPQTNALVIQSSVNNETETQETCSTADFGENVETFGDGKYTYYQLPYPPWPYGGKTGTSSKTYMNLNTGVGRAYVITVGTGSATSTVWVQSNYLQYTQTTVKTGTVRFKSPSWIKGTFATTLYAGHIYLDLQVKDYYANGNLYKTWSKNIYHAYGYTGSISKNLNDYNPMSITWNPGHFYQVKVTASVYSKGYSVVDINTIDIKCMWFTFN